MFDTLGTLYIILSKAVENNFLDLPNIALFNCVNMIAIVPFYFIETNGSCSDNQFSYNIHSRFLLYVQLQYT